MQPPAARQYDPCKPVSIRQLTAATSLQRAAKRGTSTVISPGQFAFSLAWQPPTAASSPAAVYAATHMGRPATARLSDAIL